MTEEFANFEGLRRRVQNQLASLQQAEDAKTLNDVWDALENLLNDAQSAIDIANRIYTDLVNKHPDEFEGSVQ